VLRPGIDQDKMTEQNRKKVQQKKRPPASLPLIERGDIKTMDFTVERHRMVDEQLITREIKSEAVLDAMRNVPRHLFLPENMQNYAYEDNPIPIGWGQTISQPYIVAYMTEQIEVITDMKILEIGTGSGYQAAVLAYLGCQVFTIELVEQLAEGAKRVLEMLGYNGVKVRQGNGYSGWTEEAPFDAVIVTAAPESIPETLTSQLKTGGKMIIPVGGIYSVQSLLLVRKMEGRLTTEDLLPVRFVPMVECRRKDK